MTLSSIRLPHSTSDTDSSSHVRLARKSSCLVPELKDWARRSSANQRQPGSPGGWPHVQRWLHLEWPGSPFYDSHDVDFWPAKSILSCNNLPSRPLPKTKMRRITCGKTSRHVELLA